MLAENSARKYNYTSSVHLDLPFPNRAVVGKKKELQRQERSTYGIKKTDKSVSRSIYNPWDFEEHKIKHLLLHYCLPLAGEFFFPSQLGY